jgi:hypothetical protein
MQEYVNYYFQIEFSTGLIWGKKCLLKILYLWHACWWHGSCAGVKVLSYNIRVQILKGWCVVHDEIYAIWHVVRQVLSDPRGVQNYRNACQVKATPSSRLVINWQSTKKAKASVPLVLLLDPSFSPIHSLELTSALTLPFLCPLMCFSECHFFLTSNNNGCLHLAHHTTNCNLHM